MGKGKEVWTTPIEKGRDGGSQVDGGGLPASCGLGSLEPWAWHAGDTHRTWQPSQRQLLQESQPLKRQPQAMKPFPRGPPKDTPSLRPSATCDASNPGDGTGAAWDAAPSNARNDSCSSSTCRDGEAGCGSLGPLLRPARKTPGEPGRRMNATQHRCAGSPTSAGSLRELMLQVRSTLMTAEY